MPTIEPVIYAIFNIVNDDCYIGQASSRLKRFAEHRKTLRGNYHHNVYLQRAWNKHGEKCFIFVTLQRVDVCSLNEFEQRWIDRLKPEYNMAPIAGSLLGYKHSDEARANMSAAHVGQKKSEEWKAAASLRMKGNTYNSGRKQSPEEIEIRARHHRGKIVSDETKAKMSAAQAGKKISDATKAKMRAAKIGKKLSDEHRRKLSEAAKAQWARLTEI